MPAIPAGPNDVIIALSNKIRSVVTSMVPVVVSLAPLPSYKLFSYGDLVVNIHGPPIGSEEESPWSFSSEVLEASEPVCPMGTCTVIISIIERLLERQMVAEDELFLTRQKTTKLSQITDDILSYLKSLKGTLVSPNNSTDFYFVEFIFKTILYGTTRKIGRTVQIIGDLVFPVKILNQ